MPTVTFLPSGARATVPPGATLAEACRIAGFTLPTPCGGRGVCGKCRVRVLEGDVPVDERQANCLPRSFLESGWRAACLVKEYGDLVLADPVDEVKDADILTDILLRPPRGFDSVWEADAFMTPPSARDNRDDATRLADALTEGGKAVPEAVRLDYHLLAHLPESLRALGFRCRVAGVGEHILALEESENPPRRLGLAVDIGTTTLAALLCDLRDGTVLAVASRANPQSEKGDDVLGRAEYASRGPAESAHMRQLVVDAVRDLAAAALHDAGVAEQPLFIAAAGNTIMSHLLLGVTPKALAVSPFTPAFLGPIELNTRHLGWKAPHPPLLHLVRGVASHVGGDVTAGLLAHDVHRLPGRTLFMDVGTNGEVVLADSGKLLACATAAGPAFEGARIKQGMRAAPGAIARVLLSGRGMLETGTIGDKRPARGICGTGLLDAVAVLVKAGLVDVGGALAEAEAVRAGRNPHPLLQSLLHDDGDGPAIWLERPGGRGEVGVRLTQADIREFQLAKGALAAGVKVLLKTAGVAEEEVDRVLLAGGFGNRINPDSAITTGLLPRGIAPGRVRSVGNASLSGARLCLLSAAERAEAERLAGGIEYVELSGSDDFQKAFAEEMLFSDASAE